MRARNHRSFRRIPNQSLVERAVGGADVLDRILEASLGFKVPVPLVSAVAAAVYDGALIPVVRGGGFSSLSDLISEATTGGKRQDAQVFKAGTATTIGQVWSLWTAAGQPPAGTAAGAARQTGEVPTNATVGSFQQANATGGDTLHVVSAMVGASTAPNALLLYDRLFQAGSIAHSTTGAQSVTGVPTRFTGTTSAGNFAFLEVTNALGVTAHNVTLSYARQSDGATATASAYAVTLSSAAGRLPLGGTGMQTFFIPLVAGDTGLRSVTNVAFSAVSSGTSNIVMGQPLCWLPTPLAGSLAVIDGINSAFNLARVFDNACLALLEVKGNAAASNYYGDVVMVSG